MSDIFPGATAQQVGGYFPRTGVDPTLALFVVHITAGLGDALAIAKSVEAKQVTASFWTNRDGKVYQTMLDPVRMGPWTNGVLNSPDLTNRRIAAIVRDRVNPNTRCLLTIENAGLEPGAPITAAQEAACARIIAYFAKKYGVPISRETVVGHYQFDRVNRINCPSTNKAILDRIVAMAQGGSGDDVKLKGTPIEPLNNRKTTVTNATGLGLVEDPTVQPYNNITVLGAGTAFTVDWKVRGNSLLGSTEWYGGWVLTTPPQFGYLAAGGCGPLTTIEGSDASKAAADVATAAVETAKKYQ